MIEGCIAGEEASWRALAERFGPRIDRWVRRLAASGGRALRDPEVSDLRQEVLVQIHAVDCRVLREYRGISTFEAYIAGVARNVCRGWLRRSARRGAREVPLEVVRESAEDPAAAAPDDLARREAIENLRREVASLPDRDRLLVSLYVLQGLPARDVAMILGVSPNTISPLLRRLYPRLRRALGARAPGARPGG